MMNDYNPRPMCMDGAKPTSQPIVVSIINDEKSIELCGEIAIIIQDKIRPLGKITGSCYATLVIHSSAGLGYILVVLSVEIRCGLVITMPMRSAIRNVIRIAEKNPHHTHILCDDV